MTKKDREELRTAKNILSHFVARADAQERGSTIPEEKILTDDQMRELREIYALINDFIIRENRRRHDEICENMRKHPEQYSALFLKEAGFPKEEVLRLLKVREERLSAAQRSDCIQD